MGTPYSAAATRTPAPQIRAGLVGMIADEVEHSVTTRLCETTAGIGFGLAVSQGTGVKGCILGGSAFIGVTVRDIALSLSPGEGRRGDAGVVGRIGTAGIRNVNRSFMHESSLRLLVR